VTKTVKAVLFDLDGTLLDSIEGILMSFSHTLDRHLPGHGYGRKAMIQKIGEPLHAQMLQFTGGDAALAKLMVDTYRAHNAALVPTFRLYPHVKETLGELRQRGYRTGLVTSKYRPSAKLSLEVHALEAFFDLIMTADDTPRHKPDPMPLVVAAERLALDPREILYVGDSTHDLNCAHGAGCRAVAALWGPFERSSLLALSPAYALEGLLDILAIEELAGRLACPTTP
jgi:pyrophosphatase PpaX